MLLHQRHHARRPLQGLGLPGLPSTDDIARAAVNAIMPAIRDQIPGLVDVAVPAIQGHMPEFVQSAVDAATPQFPKLVGAAMPAVYAQIPGLTQKLLPVVTAQADSLVNSYIKRTLGPLAPIQKYISLILLVTSTITLAASGLVIYDHFTKE